MEITVVKELKRTKGQKKGSGYERICTIYMLTYLFCPLAHVSKRRARFDEDCLKSWWKVSPEMNEGESKSNQPIPFSIDRDGHHFHALFLYMFYTWVQNCTLIQSFFNKILNVKHGL